MSPADEQKRKERAAAGRRSAVALRLAPEVRVAIDAWRNAQPPPKPSRSEAIRRLVEMGLAAEVAPAATFPAHPHIRNPGDDV
jgi:hypothetical protein